MRQKAVNIYKSRSTTLPLWLMFAEVCSSLTSSPNTGCPIAGESTNCRRTPDVREERKFSKKTDSVKRKWKSRSSYLHCSPKHPPPSHPNIISQCLNDLPSCTKSVLFKGNSNTWGMFTCLHILIQFSIQSKDRGQGRYSHNEVPGSHIKL